MTQTNIRVFFLAMALAVLTVMSLTAQVTIGSDLPPSAGALLDLKEFAPNDQNATSTRGLQLPRVSLTDLNSLTDIGKDGNVASDPLALAGLWVHNTEESSTICIGPHVWDDSQWLPLIPGVVTYFEDIRTKADGNIERISYPTRTFGAAGTWMLENLRATTYADNLGVDKNTNDIQVTKPTPSLTHKAAYYPNADKATFDQHPELGMLYTFAAATNGKTVTINEGESSYTSGIANPIPGNVEQVGVQGICPEGWHLPSDKEWNDLEEVIANEQTGLYTIDKHKSNPWNSDGQNWRLLLTADRNIVKGHGENMKTAFVKLGSVEITGKSAPYCRGGFNILLVGVIDTSGFANGFRTSASFRSSSASGDQSTAYVRSLDRSRLSVVRTWAGRNYGYSVRCKKN